MSNTGVLLLESITLTVGVLVIHYFVEYCRSPLKQFDGPFWAKFTDWWRLIAASYFNIQETQLHLHRKYGPAVGIGPNCISLSDPSLVKVVYTARGNFKKTAFYSVNDILQNGHIISNLFSTRSNEFHRESIRPIQKLYSMTNILTVEHLADKTVATFCRRLEEEFLDGKNAEKVCDIGNWLLYYAWDVVGEVTFSEPIGFLEKGGDIDGMLDTAERALEYFAVVGQMPQLDKLLDKNPVYRIGPPSFAAAGQYCAVRMFSRLQAEKQTASDTDFLNRFLALKEEYPDIGDNEVIGYLLINILAGADTTAVILRAIVYYLLKDPESLQRLCNELDKANLQFPVAYRTAEQLPYLSAVIKEALRIHPGVGMLLERIVPSEGLKLPDGRFIAPGTIVGLNPWVVHRDKETFGDDADDFNPHRWLKGKSESEGEYEERIKRMKDADLAFGSGSRVCVGKHLALMEVYKVIPTLFCKYKFEFADLDSEWKVKNCWFTIQSNIKVKARHRNNADK